MNTRTKHLISSVALAVCALVGWGSEAEAQSGADPTRGEPTGIRESARVLFEPMVRVAGLAAPGAPIKAFAIPSITFSDGANISGATVGYINRSNPDVPVQLRMGYRRFTVEDGDDRDRVSFDGKASFSLSPTVNLAALGEVRRTLSVSRRFSAGIAADKTFGGKISLSGNLGYVNAKADIAASVEDIAPGAGLAYVWTPSTLTSFDYTFKNDADGEYNVSFTLSQWLTTESKYGPLKLNFGIARHRTVFLSISQPFR